LACWWPEAREAQRVPVLLPVQVLVPERLRVQRRLLVPVRRLVAEPDWARLRARLRVQRRR
jgi:hypothetical protein